MAKRAPRPGEGAPTKYTQKLADDICELLATGMSMRTVSKQDGMPDCATMFRWLREKPEFRKQYDIAKQESTDAMAEEIQDIADDGVNDYETDEDGKRILVAENIQRSRLRVDTRKWLMSKMKPKKYGDKMDVTSDNKPILGNTIVFADFKNETGNE